MQPDQEARHVHRPWRQEPPSSRELAGTAHALLSDYSERHPYLVLSVAGGLGYIAAAGLPSSVLRMVIRSGVRSGLTNVLRTAIGSLLEPAITGHARMYDSLGRGNGT